MVLRSLLWLALAVSVFLPSTGLAAARVQLVLDASGSMWGRVGDEPKIDVARGAVADMLDGWESGVELGLTVYGHRRKGDCSDIETLIPTGPANAAAFAEAIRGISPKGKTPLGASVRQAAKALRHHEDRAAIVLVSDGLETCGEDPCAVAAELEASGVDFTVHVVGFDLEEAEGQALRCIAENTGGNFWLARDAAGLTDAFAEVAEVVAAPAPEPAPAPPPVVVTEPAPEPEPQAEFQGVRLVPLMSADGEVITEGVSWKILAPEVDFEGKREQRASHYKKGTITESLAVGKHLVQIDYGDVHRQETIEVLRGDGETFEFVLDAALVRVNATLAEGTPALGSVSWNVVGDPDFDGNRPRIATQYKGPADHMFILPAGTHHLIASHGDASREETFTFEPGERKRISISLEAAQVRMFGTLTEGGEPVNGVSWSFYDPEKDFDGNQKRIATQYKAGPGHTFTLPAGTHQLVADHGSIKRTLPFTVTAGERKQVSIDLKGARVKLDLVPGGGQAPLGSVSWNVYDPQGNRVATQYKGPAGFILTLPEGDLRIVGEGQGLQGEMQVTLTPGEERAIQIVGAPKG